MRWFSRQAPRGGRHARGASRDVQRPAPVAAVHPRPARPQPEDEAQPAFDGVFLGFADGSRLQLPAGDPRVSAFRAVATTLAQGRR